MYKACIFDLDGTLTDTLESLTYSVNKTLEELHLTHITSEQCRRFVGNGSRVLLERALQAAGDKELLHIEEAVSTYARIFKTYCTYHVESYDGIPQMLEKLMTQGVQLGVLSNKPDAQANHVIETIFGNQVFTCVKGQCDEMPKKPDPTGAWFVAQHLHARPEECLYVGDSDVDIETGTAAGMNTIGVTWGFREKEVLLNAGAKHTIDKPAELIDLLEELEQKKEED
ncbi:MAG: HAD family hydrolase [Lachnospiraceae bacterium]